MEFKQLEAFVFVVEQKSFSKAAKLLFLTQPTVSAHVNSLERELGTKLLERTTKNVAVTVEGERLYGYARELIEIKEDILEEFLEKKKSQKVLKLAGSTMPSQHMMPELVPVFQKQYPEVLFSMSHGESNTIIQDLLAHKADIGLVGGNYKDPRLVYIPFYEDELVIITPNTSEYREFLEENISLEQLMRAPIILRENHQGDVRMADVFLKQAKIALERLNVVARINDQEMIKASVGQGMGISIISRKAAQNDIDLGKILMYQPQVHVRKTLYIVFEKKKKMSRIEKAFVDFVENYYKTDK